MTSHLNPYLQLDVGMEKIEGLNANYGAIVSKSMPKSDRPDQSLRIFGPSALLHGKVAQMRMKRGDMPEGLQDVSKGRIRSALKLDVSRRGCCV